MRNSCASSYSLHFSHVAFYQGQHASKVGSISSEPWARKKSRKTDERQRTDKKFSLLCWKLLVFHGSLYLSENVPRGDRRLEKSWGRAWKLKVARVRRERGKGSNEAQVRRSVNFRERKDCEEGRQEGQPFVETHGSLNTSFSLSLLIINVEGKCWF